jgi:hypothetical protein
LTRETRFRDEAFKHLRQLIQSSRLPWPSNPYEVNHNLTYYALLCDFWNITEMAAEFDWKGAIREYWHAEQESFDADGLPRFGPYDTGKRSFTPYPSTWDPVEKKWQSATCQSNLLLVQFAAMLALTARHTVWIKQGSSSAKHAANG